MEDSSSQQRLIYEIAKQTTIVASLALKLRVYLQALKRSFCSSRRFL